MFWLVKPTMEIYRLALALRTNFCERTVPLPLCFVVGDEAPIPADVRADRFTGTSLRGKDR